LGPREEIGKKGGEGKGGEVRGNRGEGRGRERGEWRGKRGRGIDRNEKFLFQVLGFVEQI